MELEAVPFVPYHNGNYVNKYGRRLRGKEDLKNDHTHGIRSDFVVWDGEGANLSGDDKPQHYILFGACTPEPSDSDYVRGRDLSHWDCLRHIINVGRRWPGCYHVSYSFN